MFCTTGDVGAVKHVYAHSNSLQTVQKRWFFCGSLLPGFVVRVSVTFHLICVYNFLVRFVLLIGHLWERVAHSVDHMFLSVV